MWSFGRPGCAWGGFDQGLEAGQGSVPVLGDEGEVLPEVVDGFGGQLEAALAAGAGAADEAGCFEDAEVLGDGLAGEAGALGELSDRARVGVGEFCDEGEPGLVPEGGEEVGGL